MFKKILVAMDMSDMGAVVFERALSLAQQHQSQLILLHVLSSEESNSPIPVPPDLRELYPAVGNDLTLETWREQWENFKNTGEKTLQQRVEKAKSINLNADYQQVVGSPGKTICKIAKERDSDLIIVGHRGLSGLGEMFLGSVSNYVLHHSHCSILMVQMDNKE